MAAAESAEMSFHAAVAMGHQHLREAHRESRARHAAAVDRLITAAQASAPAPAYCTEGDRCVCGGDTPAVRAGCANWVAAPAVKGRLTTADPVVPEYSDAWLLGRAAEAGMTVAAIERALPGAMTIASAHLPAAADPVRAALVELVAVRDLKDELQSLRADPYYTTEADTAEARYEYRKPRAWEAARAALAPQPVVQEQRYRLLERGEPVLPGDERLEDDCKAWSPVERWTFRAGYDPACFVPMRRRAHETPASQQEQPAKDAP